MRLTQLPIIDFSFYLYFLRYRPEGSPLGQMTLVFDSFGVLNVIEILDILLYCGDKGSFIQNDPQKDEAD